MTFCQLYDLRQFGRSADIAGLALATTSWNIGTDDCLWFSSPDERHPFIAMNLYRLKDDRFEQIGQSWIKHGFFALSGTQCGGQCTHGPGHPGGEWLGLGCTDTYGSGLNAAQGGLGPRYEVNPWTGAWTYAGSHFSTSHSHDNQIEHRLQVHDADLDPAQNPGATYYAEGFYVMLDDIDLMNSASWKPITVSGSPGGTWTFGMSGSGTQPNIGFAIDVWSSAQQAVLAQEVPPVEFVSPDGRCVLSAEATDLGGGQWHYEYALLNVDMDRKVGSFGLPITPGTNITNIGFHAVEHHDEQAAGFSNTPWTATIAGGAITWSTQDNPVRWSTLYNFRFDADVSPNPTDVTVTLGLFDPGTPADVTGTTIAPQQGPADCNNNGIPDDCDLDCGLPGGACDVPGCGGSTDCNGNGVPDDCETDCNGNGVPDDCDVDPTDPDGDGAVSSDCNSNGTPDECEVDSDGDGVPDDCDVCPGFDDTIDTDADGVPDGCDACPGFDDRLDGDADGVPDDCDNCPNDPNPGQEDEDQDGVGNVCDPDYCNSTPENEHFDTDPAWTMVNPSATDGQWDWGAPVGGGDRFDPPDDFDGNGACYLTDNVDGNSDVDGGATRLLSPIYDLSTGTENAVLSYAYWIGTNNPLGGNDSLVVEVSNDGGASWSTIATYTTNNQQWLTATVTLDPILALTGQMQLRFSATDGYPPTILEAGIDAVTLAVDCFPDCNNNGVDDAIDIANGTSQDANGNGVPDECETLGDPIQGGKLWDRWWAVNGAPVPQGDHPLYPPAGQQSGSITWRCKECHGWDYKGASGAYGSGPHFTGIPGVFGSTMTPQQMFDIVKLDPGQVTNGHGFGSYGLSDQDVWDVVAFMQSLVIDTDIYIDAAAQFLGDELVGGFEYTSGGSLACMACHGADGRAINFGTPELPEFVGTIAVNNPWELLHKIRVGQPGVPMPSWLLDGGTDQGAADIGRYAQLNLCVGSLDGDMDGDGDTDGADIAVFVDAVISASTAPADLCSGDFSGDGVLDAADAAGMVAALLVP